VHAGLSCLQAIDRIVRARLDREHRPGTLRFWPMGPSRPKSIVLTEIEEAMVVELRRRTLLPLDGVLGC
jgi:hypothetical protein